MTVCQRGRKLSEGAAAWIRHAGGTAEALAGGFEAWAKAGLPLVPEAKLPPRDRQGRTVWVTRARPKIDRIACPWLIRRFVDPGAVFLFVAPAEVEGVADRFAATPFDVENVFWSHRGEECTFDVMVAELRPRHRAACCISHGSSAPPTPLGWIWRLRPLACSPCPWGCRALYADDLAQLEAGLGLYDALYRWCRDATDETHNWPTNKPAA